MKDHIQYTSSIHHRRTIRLKGYDYSQAGMYFITICTFEHKCVFGEIVKGDIHLNEFGEIVRQEWEKTPMIRSEIILGEYVIMPNHPHGIVIISHNDDDNATRSAWMR